MSPKILSLLPSATHRRRPSSGLCLIVMLSLTCTVAQLKGRSIAAADLAPRPRQSDNLSALIDGLQNKFARMPGLAADFTQVYVGADGRTASESGHLVLKRPGRARWEYTQPERKLFVSDGKHIFFYVYGERQATQASIKESADPQIPFLFLLGRGNLRRDFSRIEIAANERPASAGNIVLLLVPKRAPQEFKQLLVEVSPSPLAVHRMVIFERNGARMDFRLANIRENFVAPESDFQFIPPPGVSIRKAQ